ncbi:MAG: aspartate kinase [Myxococcota bacterium]
MSNKAPQPTTAPSCIVQKYGGSSLQDVARLKQVARLIQQRHQQGQRLCVVVSAMGDTTNVLLSQAKSVTARPAARELDMLLTCGERMSMALLAMALHELQVPCVSFTGSQSGIVTDGVHTAANIVDVRPLRVQQQLQRGKVVIVAGFQGVSADREITTLQRGGSDATAVALAAALKAQRCEIYSDVQGVYTADPRLVPQAQLLPKLHFNTMRELSVSGAQVLNTQAVQLAAQHRIPLHAYQTGSPQPGTIVDQHPSTHPHDVVALSHIDELCTLMLPDPTLLDNVLTQAKQEGLRVFHVASSGLQGCGNMWLLLQKPLRQAMTTPKWPKTAQQGPPLTAVSWVSTTQAAKQIPNALTILQHQGVTVQAFCSHPLRASLFVPTQQGQQALQILHNRLLAA